MRTNASEQEKSPSVPSCRILLADREPCFLQGMRTSLEPHASIKILAAVTSSHEIAQELSLPTDVVLTGFRLACGRHALGFAEEILAVSPGMSLVVFLDAASAIFLNRLIDIGVRGVLSRTMQVDKILPAINTVMAGGVFVDPDIAPVRPRPDSAAGVVNPTVLTSRELDIFRLLGKGESSKEIAEQLNLSIKTVSNHREHIKSKLRLCSGIHLNSAAKAYSLWEACGVDYTI